MEVAPQFRLDADHARAVLAEVNEAVSDWRTAAWSVGLDEAAVHAMAPAFDHGRLHHA